MNKHYFSISLKLSQLIRNHLVADNNIYEKKNFPANLAHVELEMKNEAKNLPQKVSTIFSGNYNKYIFFFKYMKNLF